MELILNNKKISIIDVGKRCLYRHFIKCSNQIDVFLHSYTENYILVGALLKSNIFLKIEFVFKKQFYYNAIQKVLGEWVFNLMIVLEILLVLFSFHQKLLIEKIVKVKVL